MSCLQVILAIIFPPLAGATMTKNSSILGGLHDFCCINHDKHN